LSQEVDSKYPTYQEARASAGLPEWMTVETLAGRQLSILAWEPETLDPGKDGREVEGFIVTAEHVKTGRMVQFEVSQKILVKELQALKPPFNTIIIKVGRTYKFS